MEKLQREQGISILACRRNGDLPRMICPGNVDCWFILHRSKLQHRELCNSLWNMATEHPPFLDSVPRRTQLMGDFPLVCCWQNMLVILGMACGSGLATCIFFDSLRKIYILQLIWDLWEGLCRPCGRYPDFAKGAFGIWGKRISSVTSMFLAPAFAYGCFHKWSYPQSSSILIGFSLTKTIQLWQYPHDDHPMGDPGYWLTSAMGDR